MRSIVRHSLLSLDIEGYWRLYTISNGEMVGSNYIFLFKDGEIFPADNITKPWDEESINNIDILIHTMNMVKSDSAYLKLIRRLIN